MTQNGDGVRQPDAEIIFECPKCGDEVYERYISDNWVCDTCDLFWADPDMSGDSIVRDSVPPLKKVYLCPDCGNETSDPANGWECECGEGTKNE